MNTMMHLPLDFGTAAALLVNVALAAKGLPAAMPSGRLLRRELSQSPAIR